MFSRFEQSLAVSGLSPLSPAASAQSENMVTVRPAEAYTRQQLSIYTLDLVQIRQVRSAHANQKVSLRREANQTLQPNFDGQSMEILRRHDLDVPTFNATSVQVDKRRSVRRRVRQALMRNHIGL